MAKIIAKDTVKVFSFPESEERIKIAMESITGLTKKLRSRKYEIDLSISFEKLHEQYPDFSEFLRRFYKKCKKHHIFLDHNGQSAPLRILSLFDRVIRAPGADVKGLLSAYVLGKAHFMQSFVEEARSHSEEWRPAIGLQVHMLEDHRFLGPEDAHGTACLFQACEACRTALVAEEYPKIIYHEFLHLFGVGEGYDEEYKPKSGCEKCWMQYEARDGNDLCKTHLKELRDFFERMKGKEIE
ncbi:MAG: hypothetical protein V1784_08090 [bacterium]